VSRSAALDDLRAAYGELLGAERRLRGRDPHRPGDLSFGQMRALHLLSREEEATAGALAKRADLSPASMTAVLDQLEDAGMIQRRRSETDRRQVIVVLTDQGAKRLAEKQAAWQQRWARELGGSSEADLEAAARVMRSIAAMLDGVGR
jgi:MarR family transcriptional regulator, organic hydroperoxide resistance regulator